MTGPLNHPIVAIAALATVIAVLLPATASAQPVCRQVVTGGQTGTFPGPVVTTLCAPNADFFRDQEVIQRRDHLQSGAYRDVPEAKRIKRWPLGSPYIQNCRFCLEPDRQNAARIERLRRPQ